MPDANGDRIEKLQRSLYSRSGKPGLPDDRSGVHRPDIKVAEQWRNPTSPPEASDGATHLRDLSDDDKYHPFFKKLLLGALGFFLVSVGVALFIFFGGFNSVSNKNVDISVLGPVTVAGGEELSLDILIRNNNNTTIQGAELLVEYPSGTRVAHDLTTELTRHREVVGDIESGQEASRTVKAVLFGAKDEVKDIKITLEYQVQNSNATFVKEKDYQIILGTAPVVMTVDYPKEINANQEVTFSVTLASNSNADLEDLLLVAEYPFGFVFGNSNPAAVKTNNVWAIGTIRPEDKRTITIKGRIEGQNDEERSFRFYAGVRDPKDGETIGTQITSSIESITIKRPFIGLNLRLNGSDDSELISRLGSQIQGAISFTNNLPNKISNATIEAKILGPSLDRTSVSASAGGFYRSSDNVVLWDYTAIPSLRDISPGGNSSVSFNFNTIAAGAFLGGNNKELTVDISIKGSQAGGTGAPVEVVSTLTKKIKISSDLSLSARAVYGVGPFSNTGPLPPKADQPTTYTIILNAANSFNDVTGVKVLARLPTFVDWVAVTSPSGETIAYDEVNRQVVWTVGQLRSSTSGTTLREVAFQVRFNPSLSQVGSSPNLLEALIISGRDAFTGSNLEVTRNPVTIRLSNDPTVPAGHDRVIP